MNRPQNLGAIGLRHGRDPGESRDLGELVISVEEGSNPRWCDLDDDLG